MAQGGVEGGGEGGRGGVAIIHDTVCCRMKAGNARSDLD